MIALLSRLAPPNCSSPQYGTDYAAVTATMKAGSVMLFDSALWHGKRMVWEAADARKVKMMGEAKP